MRFWSLLLLPIALTTACSEVPRQTQSELGAVKLCPINIVSDIRGQRDVVQFEGPLPNRMSGSVRANESRLRLSVGKWKMLSLQHNLPQGGHASPLIEKVARGQLLLTAGQFTLLQERSGK